MTIEDSIKKVFKNTWNLFSNQFVILILATLVSLLLMIFIITIPPLIYGLNYMCVQLMNKKKIKVSDVFVGFKYFFRSWGLLLLGALGIAGGLILFIIPGLILIILWQYVFAISVMENKGVIASLKRSYHLGKKNFSFSIVFWILIAIIGSIGSITRIGMFVTIPFVTLATCIAVKELTIKKKTKKK